MDTSKQDEVSEMEISSRRKMTCTVDINIF